VTSQTPPASSITDSQQSAYSGIYTDASTTVYSTESYSSDNTSEEDYTLTVKSIHSESSCPLYLLTLLLIPLVLISALIYKVITLYRYRLGLRKSRTRAAHPPTTDNLSEMWHDTYDLELWDDEDIVIFESAV
jgi:hypothetical protein